MVEQAFIISPDSSLYKKYFDAEAERNKFHQLAREFFAKYGFTDDGYTGYYIREDLCTQLSPQNREKYSKQLRKLIDTNEVCYFKINSQMNKAWRQDVVSKCDMSRIDSVWFWYYPFIDKGKYALWHDKAVLYGYLLDERKTVLELADWMIPIKMSKYYEVQEAIKERGDICEQ